MEGAGAAADQNKKKNKPPPKYSLAPHEDIVEVIKMAVGDKDALDIDDWRALFQQLMSLEFLDYRREISRLWVFTPIFMPEHPEVRQFA